MRQEKCIFQRNISRVKFWLAFIYVESGSGEPAALERGDKVVVRYQSAASGVYHDGAGRQQVYRFGVQEVMGLRESPARAGSGTGSRGADPPDPCGRRHRPRCRQATQNCCYSESSFRIRVLDAPRLVLRAPFRISRGPYRRVAIPVARRDQGASTLPFEPVPEPRKPDAKRPGKKQHGDVGRRFTVGRGISDRNFLRAAASRSICSKPTEIDVANEFVGEISAKNA